MFLASEELFYGKYFMGINKLTDELTKISSNSPSPIIQLLWLKFKVEKKFDPIKSLINFTDFFP